MNREELVNAQQWVGYTFDKWWMPTVIVPRITIGLDIEEILFVLYSAWKGKDYLRAWSEIERINDNFIDMSPMESSVAFLTCGHISLELENLEGAEDNLKFALVHMPRSKTHQVAVISWLLGVVYWGRPGKHADAINLWKNAIAGFTTLWREGSTGMAEKYWYNLQLQVMRRVLRLAIREDRLPPLDSVPGAAPPRQPPLLFAAAKNGPFSAEQDEKDAGVSFAVDDTEEEPEPDLQAEDLQEDDLQDEPEPFDLDNIPGRVEADDSDQIEIVQDLFPHDTPAPQDFLRILAVYEKIAAGPEAVVKPTPLNPAGVDGLDIDAYIEVTQVRIGDVQYYVKNLKSVSNAGSTLVSEAPHFILRVAGDSMNQAGIDDGDYVIVRAQSQGNNGDIVVVQIKDVDTRATLKRLQSETKDRIILRPETDNPDIDPDGFIFSKKDLNDSDKVMILGVAVAVLKPS